MMGGGVYQTQKINAGLQGFKMGEAVSVRRQFLLDFAGFLVLQAIPVVMGENNYLCNKPNSQTYWTSSTSLGPNKKRDLK